jgi:hypothetical protein
MLKGAYILLSGGETTAGKPFAKSLALNNVFRSFYERSIGEIVGSFVEHVTCQQI